MEDTPKVSIILPVHNGERFVAQALDSLRAQTMGDFEILCIDDGSTDSTASILASYAERDVRISVITQENAGPGIARNRGLDAATGDFVYCLDSDDLVAPDLLARAVDAFEKSGADMVLFALRTFNQQLGRAFPASWGMKHPESYPTYPMGSFDCATAPDFFFETVMNVPWNKMVRRSLLEKQHIRFQDLYLTEDVMYSLPAAVCARKIVRLAKPLVTHREFEGDSLMDAKDRHPQDFLRAFDAFHRWLEERGIYEPLRVSWQRWLLNSIYYNMTSYESAEAFDSAYDLLVEDDLRRFDLAEVEPAVLEGSDYGRLYDGLKSGSKEGFLLACANSAFTEAEAERLSSQRKQVGPLVAAQGLYERLRTGTGPAQRLIGRLKSLGDH